MTMSLGTSLPVTPNTLCPQLLAVLLWLCGQPLHLHGVHKVEWGWERTGKVPPPPRAQHVAAYLPKTLLFYPRAQTQDLGREICVK